MIVCAEMVQPLPLGLVINEWQVELHIVCELCQCQEEGKKKNVGLHVPLFYIQGVMPFKLIWDLGFIQAVINLLENPEE